MGIVPVKDGPIALQEIDGVRAVELSPDAMMVFSPYRIGGKAAPNRFVAQAMEANDGEENGKVSARGIERYRRLAHGKWGIVIVEALSISETSLARKNGMILNETNLDSFKRLVEEFKKINPDTLLFFQITHAGQKSGPFSRKVSACPEPPEGFEYLSDAEIESIRTRFADGALLAERAGADGVDFKMCHGYLGAELLRPANTRNDRWGGSFENRTRFLREGIEDIKSRLKGGLILGSRISLYEAVRGGCGTAAPEELVENLDEMRQVVRVMKDLGMQYVNVSAGIPGVTSEVTRPTRPSKFLFLQQFRYAKTVKDLETGLAVIGSAYTILGPEAHLVAEENIRKGNVDFVGFGRQIFADPDYPRKVQEGRIDGVDWCVACSGCSRLMIAQENDGCIMYDDYYRGLINSLHAR